MDFSMDFSDAHAALRKFGYYAHGIYLSPDDIRNRQLNLEPGDYWAVLPIGTEFRFERLDSIAYFVGPRTGVYDRFKSLYDLLRAVDWAETRYNHEKYERSGYERAKYQDLRLIFAVKDGDIMGAQWLLDCGADVNLRDSPNGWTALLYATENHDTNIVKALLEKGANPNIEDNNGRTALINASRFGLRDIVKVLIEKGANVSLRSNAGETALSEA
ncbi:MAG: ankyrin repeat domain-containing protein, partial [Proteobacteria bacterium]|nr:ankyrin repeat domain-containing protein [Pseudomonadota bacterium]